MSPFASAPVMPGKGAKKAGKDAQVKEGAPEPKAVPEAGKEEKKGKKK